MIIGPGLGTESRQAEATVGCGCYVSLQYLPVTSASVGAVVVIHLLSLLIAHFPR